MATDDRAQLSALIGSIYDAALEPVVWTSVLEEAGSFVGGSAASIFSQDAVSKVGNSYHSFGIDAHYEQLYFKRCIRIRPAEHGLLDAQCGRGDEQLADYSPVRIL